jgi:molybdate transport system substrate-binding protein
VGGRVSFPNFRKLVRGAVASAGCTFLAFAPGPRLAGAVQAPAPATASGPQEISVYAAASLADVLTEIGKTWQSSSGHRPVFNFGASSDLARQILAGAPADVFFSADAAQMGLAIRQGLVRAGDRTDLLSNTLVVIVPKESAARVAAAQDLASFGKIALADPEAVPAGVYARAWLEAKGVWSALEDRVVPTLHVRAALAAVESGNVDAGIVYKTDAARSTRARIALEVKPDEGPKIVYPLAPLAAAKPAASSFVAYLQTPAAREVFVRHGFLVLGDR